MAAISAGSTREEKKNWLFMPFWIASNVAFFFGVIGAVYLLFGLEEPKYIAGVAVLALLATYCLLLWQMRRIHLAEQGRL